MASARSCPPPRAVDSGDVSENPETPEDAQPARPRRSFWQRMGGEGLTISLIIHLVLILIGRKTLLLAA